MQFTPKVSLGSVLVALLLVSSCTTMESVPDEPVNPQATDVSGMSEPATPELTPVTSDAPPAAISAEPVPKAASKPTLYRGTDELVRMPKARTPVRFYGEAVSLNFEQAPLTEVVHAVMGDILELDYFVEHPINGEVTLRTRTPIPRDQLLDILESLLKANSALMVRDADGRFFVSSSAHMSKLKPSVAASASGVAGFSTVIIPLQFISASGMAEILAPVAEESAFVRVDNVRNILMLAGTRAQLSGWQEMITTFDVDLLKGMSVGIFPIENSSIEEVEEALGSLLSAGTAGGDSVEAAAGLGSIVRIIPIPRLSSLLVVTPRAHYLTLVGNWIERLDKEPNANYERRLYVYEVQNSNAVHLADLLSTIYGGTSGSSRGKGGVAPGLTPEKVSGKSKNKNKNQTASSGQTGSSSTNFDVGDVRVVADEENNALLIYATGKEYRKIKPALAQLDVAATQVIIEASIVEVTLTDDLEYGLEWAFSGGLGGDYSGEGQLRLPSDRDFSGNRTSGFAYSVLNGAGQVKAVLRALADENLLNVISSPSIMVLDNHTATIQVGDQVPISTGSSVDDGVTTESISFKDTGVQLSVTPSVNAGGMVTMDIDQSVTDVGQVDAATRQRTFLERKITSRVAVRSGESVVLGGLIRENKSEGSSGIPFLHNLPLVGGLFGTKVLSNSRTELLVIITPRAIYSDSELRDVSREMRAQMRGLDLIKVSETSAFLHDPKKDVGKADNQEADPDQ